jgi:hypothetical protein
MSVNRSEEIRRFFDQHPGARPKECIIALAARGIDVSPTLVSCVRAKLKERNVPERDMGQDVVLVRAFVDSSGLDPEVAVEILSRFADVVERVGGLGRFREVLEVVEAEVDPRVAGGEIVDMDSGVKHGGVPVVVAEEPEVSPPSSEGFYYDDVNDEDDD